MVAVTHRRKAGEKKSAAEEKHSNVLLEFSSSSWLSLSFLILDSKVGSVVTKVCVGFLL